MPRVSTIDLRRSIRPAPTYSGEAKTEAYDSLKAPIVPAATAVALAAPAEVPTTRSTASSTPCSANTAAIVADSMPRIPPPSITRASVAPSSALPARRDRTSSTTLDRKASILGL